MLDKIVGHCSFLGFTGYANHTRDFFTHLNRLIPVKIRNFAWAKDISYLTQEQKDMIYYNTFHDKPPFNTHVNDFTDCIHLVLLETNHYYFYHNYKGPKIAYNVWESTRQPQHFFNRLLDYDQLWVPTEWQRQCSIEQGYPEDRVKVVHEGVDGNIFKPDPNWNVTRKSLYKKYNIPEDKFCFAVFGRWDYRKSIEEMIRAFLEEFKNDDDVILIASVDNPFSNDGFTTKERLKHCGLESDKIKVISPLREEYIQWMRSCHVFLSCSRSEGWNLLLIEAIASGIPSIASGWGAQLEFCKDISNLVNVPEFKPPEQIFMMKNPENIGVWGEPDFEHLKNVMRDVYNNYDEQKSRALEYSEITRNEFSWDNAAKQAYKIIDEFRANYKPITKKLIDYKIIDSNRAEFTWHGEERRKVEGYIIEEYTGLNLYKCFFDLEPEVTYYFAHAEAVKNRMIGKTFRLVDVETGEYLFNERVSTGDFNLSKVDYEEYLKNYYDKTKVNDNALALPLYEIFVNKDYESDICSVEPNDIVVDIGANAGFFSTYAYYKGYSKCYAFEPVKHIYESTKKQLSDLPNFEIDNVAIDNYTGKTKIYVPKNDTVGSSLKDRWEHKQRDVEECNVIRFMDMVKKKRLDKIDFLKIDCEGSEYNIIYSIPDQYLRNNIKKIAMEFHDNYNGEIDGVAERLQSLGFKTKIVYDVSNFIGRLYAAKEKHNMELYQDQYVNGEIIQKGKVDNESRYEALKSVFDLYKRPFTILDIGANFGYYSLRATTEYDAYSVMIEDGKGEVNKILELCDMNDCKDRLMVLNTKMNLEKLKELEKCEHFDVILALNVLHHFDESEVSEALDIIERMAKFGSDVIIETPSDDDEGACGKSNLKIVNDRLRDHDWKKHLGNFKRHTSDNAKSNMYLLYQEVNYGILPCPYYGYERLFDIEYLDEKRLKEHNPILVGSFYNKKTVKTRNEEREWIPGINLKTFIELNGVYPYKETIIKKIHKRDIITDYRWDNTNNDLVLHNFILSGSNLHLIDFNDKFVVDKLKFSDKNQIKDVIGHIYGSTLSDKEKIRRVHIDYVSTVSTKEMAASLKTCLKLYDLCNELKPKYILERGSGFSTFVLALYKHNNPDVRIDSIDTDKVWMSKTRNFISKFNLYVNSFSLWENFDKDYQYDLIFEDTKTELRKNTINDIYKMLSSDGQILFDDANRHDYLESFAKKRNMSYVSLKDETLDEFDRYSALVYKNEYHIKDNDVIIVNAYTDTKEKKKTLRECISQLKKTGKEIILTTHYPVDTEVQNLVNYYIYDSNNPMLDRGCYFWYENEEFMYRSNKFNLSKKAYANMLSMKNGVELAKKLDKNFFYYFEYDNIIDDSELHKLNELRTIIDKENKEGYVQLIKTNESYMVDYRKSLSLLFFAFYTDFFMDKFKFANSKKEYEKMSREVMGLEWFFYDNMKDSLDKLIIDEYDRSYPVYFKKSKIGNCKENDNHFIDIVKDKDSDKKIFIIITKETEEDYIVQYTNLDKTEYNTTEYNIKHDDYNEYYYDVLDPNVYEINVLTKYNKLVYSSTVKDELERKDSMFVFKNKGNPIVNYNFIDGPFVEIKGGPLNDLHNIKFIDDSNNEVIHEDTISTNHWVKANRKYYTDWRIEINGNVTRQNLKNENVMISFESKSLGDTIGWIPFVEEFRKKHECNVYVSTFWNNLFDYPKFNWIKPGTTVKNLYAKYRIGCVNPTEQLNKVHWMDIPLQKISADILGIEYTGDLKPKLKYDKSIKKENLVSITEHSTAKCKYWNYNEGWQKVVDYINNQTDFNPMVISKEKTKLKNIINETGKPIQMTINNILRSQVLITISSGLSWLAWGLNIPVIMISGCTEEWNEFKCDRIVNENVCHGCLNNSKYFFDRSWNWCPEDKNFECTKSIRPNMVIKKIEKYK